MKEAHYMKLFQLFILLLILICLPIAFFAQIPGRGISTKSEKTPQPEMKAAEQILVDVKSLKSPQDRAYILGYVGEYVCKNGEKARAEKIFEESFREITVAQKSAKKTDGNIYENLIYGNFPRRIIIQSIANCDAEIAYKFLLQSRPPKLSQILDDFYKKQIYPEPKSVADEALNIEIERESSIKSQIIQKRPDLLAKLINQNIENAITYRTIDLLKELNKKDSALAAELTKKAINKILQLKFYDYEKKKPLRTGYFLNLSTAISFLRELGNDSPRGVSKINISEETLIRLADIISKETINSGLNWLSSDSLKTVERFFPERIEQLEKIKTDNLNSPDNLEKRNYRQMFNENLADEAILTTSENFSESNRKNVFRLIACRQVREGKFDKAKSLINEKFGGKGNPENLLSYVFYSNALRFFLEEDFENASALAKRIPDPLKNLDAQIFLLERFYAKNPEQNKAESLILLSELTKQFDSNSDVKNRVSGLGKILRVNALINAEQAFPLFEFLIYETNKTDDIDSFFGYLENTPTGSIRVKSSIKFEYPKTIKNLAKSDIDRTLLIINKLKRPVSRITLKLSIIKNNYSDYHYEDILDFCRLNNSPFRVSRF